MTTIPSIQNEGWKWNWICLGGFGPMIVVYGLKKSTSVNAKSCMIEKDTTFTHFVPKLLHISSSKILYIYPLTTITVHIYTVTVACVYNILIISDSLLFFSLFSNCKTNPPSSCSFFLWYTHSHRHKIKNQLKTSKINH